MSEVVYSSFTKIPNALLEILSKHTLPAYETRILNQILRQTLGWNRLGYYTSLRDLGELCAMDYRHVGRTLKALEARRIVATRKAKRNTHIELNLNYMQWWLKEPPGLFVKKPLSPEEATLVDTPADALSPGQATAVVASGGDTESENRRKIDEITAPFKDRFKGQ